jgi:hypothetical protein
LEGLEAEQDELCPEKAIMKYWPEAMRAGAGRMFFNRKY